MSPSETSTYYLEQIAVTQQILERKVFKYDHLQVAQLFTSGNRMVIIT